MRFLLMVVACIGVLSCGTDNLAGDRAELTPEQEAKIKMNESDYAAAIEILEPLYEANPEEYFRIPLLSAAYAGSAGIDVLSIVENSISGSGGGSIFSQIGSFLPEGYTLDDVNTMDQSVDALNSIPEDLRGAEGDPDYGSSAEFQLVLYQSLYATMYLNLFLQFDANGNLDLNALANLSADDVRNILGALAGAAAASDSEQTAAIGSAVGETLTGIDDADGSDDREKLINYAAENESG